VKVIDLDKEREEREQQIEKLDGVMDQDDVAIALHVSRATLRGMGIPHVKVTSRSRIYFNDEVVSWLRSRARSL